MEALRAGLRFPLRTAERTPLGAQARLEVRPLAAPPPFHEDDRPVFQAGPVLEPDLGAVEHDERKAHVGARHLVVPEDLGPHAAQVPPGLGQTPGIILNGHDLRGPPAPDQRRGRADPAAHVQDDPGLAAIKPGSQAGKGERASEPPAPRQGSEIGVEFRGIPGDHRAASTARAIRSWMPGVQWAMASALVRIARWAGSGIGLRMSAQTRATISSSERARKVEGHSATSRMWS